MTGPDEAAQGDLPTKRAKARQPGNSTSKREAKQAKERLFVEAYLANGCIGAKAYVEAGYRAKNAHVAAVMANRLLRKPDIARLVKERRDDALREARITANDVMASKARDLNFDPAKLFYAHGRKKGQLKPIQELDENTRRALRVEMDADGNVKFKGPDYNTAREQAMKHFGLYERDNKQKPFYTPPQIIVVPVEGRRSDEESRPAIPFVVEGVKGKG